MNISATHIRKVLSDCAVNPKSDVRWKVILASGGFDYFVGKAREFILDGNLKSAITALAVAQVIKDGPQEVQKRSRT